MPHFSAIPGIAVPIGRLAVVKTLPAKAALYARLPALIELEPVTYAFRDEEPVPMAAEDPKPYYPNNRPHHPLAD